MVSIFSHAQIKATVFSVLVYYCSSVPKVAQRAVYYFRVARKIVHADQAQHLVPGYPEVKGPVWIGTKETGFEEIGAQTLSLLTSGAHQQGSR
jgi:hypothetical protein